MKKVETHLHTSPVSCCSRLTAEAAAEKYRKCGFDAVMLTNHYSRSYIECTPATEKEWLDRFIEGYYEMKKECEKRGMEAWLGAEVTLFAPYAQYERDRYPMDVLEKNFADYILVGVTEKFLRETPMLCDLDLKTLHAICREHNVLLIQAHPFRTEQHHSPKPPEDVDGYEINGCVGFKTTCEKEVLELAAAHNLVVTCGGDTHYDWHKLRSATFVPDEIHDSVGFAEYLRKVRVPKYSLTETDEFAAPNESK